MLSFFLSIVVEIISKIVVVGLLKAVPSVFVVLPSGHSSLSAIVDVILIFGLS